MKTYKINTITSISGDEFTTIISTDENGLVSSIPTNSANSDYQEYLKSLDEASTL